MTASAESMSDNRKISSLKPKARVVAYRHKSSQLPVSLFAMLLVELLQLLRGFFGGCLLCGLSLTG